MNPIEAGKRTAVKVWQNTIVLFIGLGLFNVITNLDSVDALVGSLVGTTGLLAVVCAGGFAYGFLRGATIALAPPVESPVIRSPLVAQPAQVAPKPKRELSEDEFTWIAALTGALLFLFWKADFDITAIPATAMDYLKMMVKGWEAILGLDD